MFKIMSLFCKIFGHRSFADNHNTIGKDYDFCERCLKSIGSKNSNQGY